MPWHIEQRDDSYCVVKDVDNSVVNCHGTRVKAIKQIRALYASETESDMVAAGGYDAPVPSMHTIPAADAPSDCPPGHHKMPNGSCMPDSEMPNKNTDSYGNHSMVSGVVPWEGVLTVEGVESGDGRMFKYGSLSWDTTPSDGMPLMWQKQTSHGGDSDVSVRVGSVTQAWREPDPAGRADVAIIKGRGFIDLGNPDGAEVHRRMSGGFMSGNSVDVDSVKDSNIEFVYDNTVTADTAKEDAEPVSIQSMFKQPQLTIYNKGRIRGTTLVEFPAFTEARLSLSEVAPSAPVQPQGTAPQVSMDEVKEQFDAIIAAAHIIELQDAPPREWFEPPVDVPALGALTITDKGRVYGYLAPAGVRHRSFPDRVVTAPKKKVDYSRFMGGETIVADGGRVTTGVLTMGCGHATTKYSLTTEQAQDHYDNSCSIFANVRVGEDRDGATWVAGALLPDVTPAMVQRAMGCRLSGDWRAHLDKPGWRELAAALLVPVPGFPMARVASSVQMEEGELVASSMPVRFVMDDEDEYDYASHTIAARDVSTDERKKLAKSGDAMPDGSYPIANTSDLHNAIQAYGRSNPGDRARVKAHIMKRARELGAESAIPEAWMSDLTAATRLALVQRIAKTVGRDRATRLAAVQLRVGTAVFHGTHNQDDHGHWADFPSGHVPKGKSMAEASKAKNASRKARGLEEGPDSYDLSHPLLSGADMDAKIPTNDDGTRVWRVDETDFDDLVRDGLQPGEEYVIADLYSTPRAEQFDPREHYVGGDIPDHLLNG